MGRPTLYNEPMEKTRISILSGHLEFLRRIDENGYASSALRQLITLAVETDEQYAAVMADVEADGYDIGDVLTRMF